MALESQCFAATPLMPLALGLGPACKLAASVSSMRTDSRPQTLAMVVLVEEISGVPATLLIVDLPINILTQATQLALCVHQMAERKRRPQQTHVDQLKTKIPKK